MTVAAIPESPLVEELALRAKARGTAVPMHVAKHLISGTSALGAGVLTERGLGFVANILAARIGGASTFGAYSLAITTAANISTYAAGGIGATAARFSGKYPHGSASYSTLARALLVVSFLSALLAAGCLWFGAGPLAHLLGKPALTPLLRWAALSAAGIIVLECARGFFVGQRRLAALLLLSCVVGLGMVVLIPMAARLHSPVRMVMAQASITIGAVLLCLAFAKGLGITAKGDVARGSAVPMTQMLREVWGFGMVQLAGLVGMNLAGWWLTTLVARADTTLVQMSFFAIASQMRNIVGLGPSLLTESSYSIMAATDSKRPQTPDQVMALCTHFSTVSALLLSAIGMIVVPWGLTLLYGHAYRGAAVTTAVALAIAVVHMGNSPAAARLTIVSIKVTGVINTIWAVATAAAGTVILLHHGDAAMAMMVILGGHLLSAVLVMTVLYQRGCVQPGVLPVVGIGMGTAIVLALLAYLRQAREPWSGAITAAMVILLASAMGWLLQLGRRHQWLPGRAGMEKLLRQGMMRVWPSWGQA